MGGIISLPLSRGEVAAGEAACRRSSSSVLASQSLLPGSTAVDRRFFCSPRLHLDRNLAYLAISVPFPAFLAARYHRRREPPYYYHYYPALLPRLVAQLVSGLSGLFACQSLDSPPPRSPLSISGLYRPRILLRRLRFLPIESLFPRCLPPGVATCSNTTCSFSFVSCLLLQNFPPPASLGATF